MKKLKKFKRFSEGGLGSSMGAGTPNFAVSSIETDEGYKREKEQGAKNLEDIKNFFMGRRSRGEASAPIEERDTSSKPPEPAKETKAEKAAPAKAAETSSIVKPSVSSSSSSSKDSAENRGETDFNYPPQREYNQALEDAKEQGRRARDAFKPAKSSTSSTSSGSKTKDPRDMEKGNSRGSGSYPINSSSSSKPSGPVPAPASSSDRRSGPTEYERELEERKRRLNSEKTKSASPDDIPGTDVKTPYTGEKIDNSNLPAKQFAQSVLGATAAGRAVGPAVRGVAALGRMMSSPRAEGKGTGKFPEEKPEITVPRTPAVERVKPKEPAPAKEQTPAEKMGLRETEPMRRAREAKEQFEAAGKGAKEAADKASKKASDEVAAEAAKRAASKRQTPDNRRFPNKGSATPGRPKARAEVKPSGNKFDRPVGEKRGPKTDEILESKGLSAKKGGKIPAFKKGGLVGRGDGCAMRGKTKGRMV